MNSSSNPNLNSNLNINTNPNSNINSKINLHEQISKDDHSSYIATHHHQATNMEDMYGKKNSKKSKDKLDKLEPENFPPPFDRLFHDENEAMLCFSEYAQNEGFSIRRDKIKKKEETIKYRSFVCSCAGHRLKTDNPSRSSTRNGCKYRITIWRQKNGYYKVTSLYTVHNHTILSKAEWYGEDQLVIPTIMDNKNSSCIINESNPMAIKNDEYAARKRYYELMEKAKQLCLICHDDEARTRTAICDMNQIIKNIRKQTVQMPSEPVLIKPNSLSVNEMLFHQMMNNGGYASNGMEMLHHHNLHASMESMASKIEIEDMIISTFDIANPVQNDHKRMKLDDNSMINFSSVDSKDNLDAQQQHPQLRQSMLLDIPIGLRAQHMAGQQQSIQMHPHQHFLNRMEAQHSQSSNGIMNLNLNNAMMNKSNMQGVMNDEQNLSMIMEFNHSYKHGDEYIG